MTAMQRITLISILTLGAGFLPAISQAAAPEYTKEQAGKGRTAYREHCATCHGAKLEGVHLAPSLMGSRFDNMWRRKSADALSYHIRRMPPEPAETSGKLGDETYSNILAYILNQNDFEASTTALPSDMAALAKLNIPGLPGVNYDPDVPVAHSPEQKQLLANLSPITNDMLVNPSPNDWLQWGGGYTGTSYSSLATIDTSNVAKLAPAWRAPLREGNSMSAPLVHDGVMFLHSFPDTVLALDASNGNVLWRYRREGLRQSTSKTGIALHGDKVFVPTTDLHMVALNAKTGDVIWDVPVAQGGGKSPRGGGYTLRAAPMVVGDILIQGVTASFVPKGGFLFALDLETGEEQWRFNTIARPGEPGGDTWNGVPLEQRSGGSVWHQYTYDAELNLIYIGVAPTYDTGPLVHPIDQKGITSSAMYTNCTVAIDPATGRMVWSYQHMANDQWDLDWVFERQIATMDFEGKPRKVVMNTGKIALLDVLDAATGEYLFSVDSGTQNVILEINGRTGEKTIDRSKWPDPNKPCDVCPNAAGARSWPPTTYSPQTNFVYVPIMEWCMRLGKEGMQLLTSGVALEFIGHPDDEDGKLARLQALDLNNQELSWAHNQVAPISSGLLTTAGGVLFAGDMEPSLKALDVTNGKVLWQAQLDAHPSASLMTYAIGETQYIAVLTGINNLHVGMLATAYKKFDPDHYQEPTGGAGIWVFALGE